MGSLVNSTGLSLSRCLLLGIFMYETAHRRNDIMYGVEPKSCTWSVQKVPRILNFRDFRFFCGVMLVLISLALADKFGHFECSVNF